MAKISKLKRERIERARRMRQVRFEGAPRKPNEERTAKRSKWDKLVPPSLKGILVVPTVRLGLTYKMVQVSEDDAPYDGFIEYIANKAGLLSQSYLEERETRMATKESFGADSSPNSLPYCYHLLSIGSSVFGRLHEKSFMKSIHVRAEFKMKEARGSKNKGEIWEAYFKQYHKHFFPSMVKLYVQPVRRSDRFPWLVASPDFIGEFPNGELKVIEIKSTVSLHKSIPARYMAQVQASIECFNLESGVILLFVNKNGINPFNHHPITPIRHDVASRDLIGFVESYIGVVEKSVGFPMPNKFKNILKTIPDIVSPKPVCFEKQELLELTECSCKKVAKKQVKK